MDDLQPPAWLRHAADSEAAATLTTQLVARRSYPGEERGVQEDVAAWLSEHGLPVERQCVEGDRINVLSRIENGPGPTLMLNGHVDTVLPVEGWSSDPFAARRDGDRLYGLGACDMKAGVAAAMLATAALAAHPDDWRGTLLFTSVVDEEAYSVGARTLIAAGLPVDCCIVAESSWEPCLGSIGKVLVRVEVTGKAGHASWPKTGVNAATEAGRFAAGLDDLPVGIYPEMEASRCLLSLHAGSEQYVMTIPERATLLVSRMTVPGETAQSVAGEMQALAASLASPATFAFSVEPPFYPPWQVDQTHPFVQSFAHAYADETGGAPTWRYGGFGDANLFAGEAGTPTVHFGPRGGRYHEADEWVDVPSIGATIAILLRTALAVLPVTSPARP